MQAGPRLFAVYYGWPSFVNGAAGSLPRALGTLQRYPLVVLGGATVTQLGDPFAGPLAVALRGERTQVYGYVNVAVERTAYTYGLLEVRRLLRAWRDLPADGVLLDCAGADYGVGRGRLERIVHAAHDQGLRTLVNAWNPDDVLAGASPLGPADGYLGENIPAAAGVLASSDEYRPKLASMVAHRARLGVRLFTVATAPRDRWQGPFVRRVLRALEPFGVDWFCMADPLYGAADNEVLGPDLWFGDDRQRGRRWDGQPGGEVVGWNR